MDKKELKQSLYVNSPYDLGTDEDSKYRNMIDEKLEADIIIEVEGGCLVEVHGLNEEQTYNIIDWDEIKIGEGIE